MHHTRASSEFHRRFFVVSAPALWNNIPADVCDSVSLDTFKTAFETRLFNCAYTPHHRQPSTGTSTWLRFSSSDTRRRLNRSLQHSKLGYFWASFWRSLNGFFHAHLATADANQPQHASSSSSSSSSNGHIERRWRVKRIHAVTAVGLTTAAAAATRPAAEPSTRRSTSEPCRSVGRSVTSLAGRISSLASSTAAASQT